MSDLTTKPTRRERARAWLDKRTAAGLHWLLLLIVVAVFTLDAWFLGVVALAWHHFLPTVKWYYSVGTDTKRNLSWYIGRFAIFAITATVFGVLWYSEGFEIAVILPVLLGISIPLFKTRDWTMLGAIWMGVVFFAEFGNGASLAAAIFISAFVQYERRKAHNASRKNLFEERDLSERRTHTTIGVTGGGLADRKRFDDQGDQHEERPPAGRVRMPHGETDHTVDLTETRTTVLGADQTDPDIPRHRVERPLGGDEERRA